MAQHDELDLVVVGSGLAGLTAAIVAHDRGLRVGVLERSSTVGGVAAVSMGKCWLPMSRATAIGTEDSRRAVEDYLHFAGAGLCDPRLRTQFLDALPEAADYLADHADVRWRLVEDADNFYPWAPGSTIGRRVCVADPIDARDLGEMQTLARRSPFLASACSDGSTSDTLTFGEALTARLAKAAFIDRRISLWCNTRAQSLMTRDSVVVGVRAGSDTGDSSHKFEGARGVILATGGSDWDDTALVPHMPPVISMCPPIVSGDHLVMAAEIGAEIVHLQPVGIHTNFGYRLPGEMHDGKPLFRNVTVEASQPHSILVNRRGRRFVDESFFVHDEVAIRAFDAKARRFDNLPAFLVFDEAARQEFGFGPFGSANPLPEPPFSRAETLAALAGALTVDAAGLCDTVERFNRFCATGIDEDFGRSKKAWNVQPQVMGPIERPPFYGIELSPLSVGIDHRGLRIDAHGRVQHVRGRSIGGLYAAGNAAAQTDVGPVYLSGVTNARGIAWGYVAALHASADSGRVASARA